MRLALPRGRADGLARGLGYYLRPNAQCLHLSPNARHAHSGLNALDQDYLVSFQSARSPGQQSALAVQDGTQITVKSEANSIVERVTSAPTGPPINSFDDLIYEACVEQASRSGRTRLVDLPEYRTNWQLWTALLDARIRIHGAKGALALLLGIEKRELELPCSDEDHAEEFWELLMKAGIRNSTLLERTVQHAERNFQANGTVWKGLYTSIVGANLYRCDTAGSLAWHTRISALRSPSREDVSHLIDIAVSRPEVLATFQDLYGVLNYRNIYDEAISKLCNQGLFREALHWHGVLHQAGDEPQRESMFSLAGRMISDSSSEEQILEGLKAQWELLKQSQPRPRTRRLPQSHDLPAWRISSEDANRIVNRMRGGPPKQLRDELAARAFATKSFSLTFALGILYTFGLQELGPQSMREIGVRCKDTQELLDLIAEAKVKRVRVKTCGYNFLLIQSAQQRDMYAFSDIVKSDMHPDCFDDLGLQQRLLDQYAAVGDLQQWKRTLMLMTHYHKLQKSVEASWNRFLQKQLQIMGSETLLADSMSVQDIHTTVDIMTGSNIKLHRQTVDAIVAKLEEAWKAVSQFHGKMITLQAQEHTGLLLKLVRAGAAVSAGIWGVLHDFYRTRYLLGDMERLSMQLVRCYSSKTGDPDTDRERLGTLNKIFDNDRLRAIIVSGFRIIGLRIERNSRARGFNSTSMEESPALGAPSEAAGSSLHLSKQEQLQPRESLAKPTSYSERTLTKEAKGQESSEWLAADDWTRGLELVQTLRRHKIGLQFDIKAVRKICTQRLSLLFGPCRPHVARDRVSRLSNPIELKHMVDRINAVWHVPVYDLSRMTETGSEDQTNEGQLLRLIRETSVGSVQGGQERELEVEVDIKIFSHSNA